MQLPLDDQPMFGWGVGHMATWATQPCSKCNATGLVGIPPFTPICPTCQGSKSVPA